MANEFDTSNATATSEDILLNKTAYVKGEKIRGSIPSKLGGAFMPSTVDQVIFPSNHYATSAFATKGDANLKQSNIKKGVSIFGVIGSAQGNEPASGTLPDGVHTVSVEPNNNLYGEVFGGGAVSNGLIVTVNSTPNENAGFYSVGWEENGKSVSADSEYTLPITESHNLTAVFSHKSINLLPDDGYIISLSISGKIGGTVSGGNIYGKGKSVTVKATPEDGYIFDSWKENGAIVSQDASYTFTADNNRNLVANFTAIASLPHYTVFADVTPEGSGSISGTGSYYKGQAATVIATPNSMYKFVQWLEGNRFVSAAPGINFDVEKNVYLTAEFSEKLPSNYIAVEYIESAGKSYIDTGVKPTTKTRILLDVFPSEAPSTTVKYLLSSYYFPSSGTKYVLFAYWQKTTSSTNSGVFFSIGGYTGTSASQTRVGSYPAARRLNIEIDLSTKKGVVNGEEKTISTTSNTYSTSMSNIRLLAYTTSVTYMTPAKLYSCQIYEGGTLIRDFVPCINSEGIAGLYETVENTFYQSENANAFTAGPTI